MSVLGTIAVAAVPAAAAINPETQQNVVKGAMQLDITTVFAAIACILSVSAIIWKGGGVQASQKAFEQYQEKLEADRKTWRDNLEKSVEQRFAAASGATTLAREQIGEVRENLAKNYMTKSEIGEIERRVTGNQDRILDHLDRIDGRLNLMQERMLEAISKAMKHNG